MLALTGGCGCDALPVAGRDGEFKTNRGIVRMLLRLGSVMALAAPLFLAGPALSKEPVATAKEPTVAQSSARGRQKKCGVEWRELSATEKTAQGPKWPQYFSKCVKRLKEQKA